MFTTGISAWSITKAAAICALLLFLLLPSAVVVILAFNEPSVISFPPKSYSMKWFSRAINYDDFRLGFYNGLIVTAWTSIIAVAIGTTCAYAIDRFEFRGKHLLETILLSPLVIPHFTVGLAFLILASHLAFARTFAIVVLTRVILVLPFVLRNVHVSLKNLDPAIAKAAESLGAPPFQVFLRINLPLLLPGILGGWLFAAILSFNEVTATIFVTAQHTQTLPVAMYAYVKDNSDPSMAAISSLYLLFTVLFVVVADRYLGLRRVLAIDAQK